MKADNLLTPFRHMMRELEVTLGAEIDGIQVDLKEVNRLETFYEKAIAKLELFLYNIAEERDEDLDLHSTHSKIRFIYRVLKLPIVKRTKKTQQPSLDRDTKEALEEMDDTGFIAALLELDYTSKMFSTYVKRMRTEYVKSDGRAHPKFNIAKFAAPGQQRQKGTVTGRMTIESPPLSNQPRSGVTKRMFISRWDERATPIEDDRFPQKGGCLIEPDYSQMELRVGAYYTRDERLMEIFEEGKRDIHQQTASWVTGERYEDVNSEMRKFAKSINFGIFYGQTEYGLAENLKVPISKAKAFRDRWLKVYSGVADWLLESQDSIRNNQEVRTVFRVRRLPGANFSTPEGRAKIRQGINSPIQGTASDICVFAMWWLRRKVFGDRGPLVLLNVYDSLLIDCPPGMIARTCRETYETMVDIRGPLKKYYGLDFDIPLDVSVSIGRSWGEVKEVI
ncbi:DNA polymerase I, thermostable [subsurface metagenome]